MKHFVLPLLTVVSALISTGASAQRVIAIGDVHGDYDAFLSILKAVDLIDDELKWSGGDTTFVQTGDLLDRGSRTRPVMDLMIRLQAEAPLAGGEVIALLGNHEAMNLLGEFRDVGLASYSDWATTGENRSGEYRSVTKAAKKRASLLGRPTPLAGPQQQAAWLEQHPPGALTYIEDLSPDGHYGTWLRQLPSVARVGDTLFLHGGLSETTAALEIEAINRQTQAEILAADSCRLRLTELGYLADSSSGAEMVSAGTALLADLRQRKPESLKPTEYLAHEALEHCEGFQAWFLLEERGPLWLRDYSYDERLGTGWQGDAGLALIEGVLEAQSVKHIVVGHTPQLDGNILPRFDGRIFLIDTGMLSSFYGGRPSALEIIDGTFSAVYSDGSKVLLHGAEQVATHSPAWSWPAKSGEALPFESEDELLDFLHRGRVVEQKVLDGGSTKPIRLTIERDGVQVRAVFRSVDLAWRNQQGPEGRFYRYFRDSYIYECAAYELSRAIGLHMVPPTLLHHHGGTGGSLQAWVENARTESDLIENALTAPDPGSYVRQLLARKFFDVLINNQDRNTGNTLVTSNWTVWLIDHTRAFFIEEDQEAIASIKQADRRTIRVMRQIDRTQLERRLRPYLNPIERKALFSRWDALLQHIDRLAEEQGEENIFYNS